MFLDVDLGFVFIPFEKNALQSVCDIHYQVPVSNQNLKGIISEDKRNYS
jgi:hypothetical protein